MIFGKSLQICAAVVCGENFANNSIIFTDDFPQQDNYTDICKCSQKCNRVTYDVRTTQAPFSDSAIEKWVFSGDIVNRHYKLENIRQWTNLDIIDRNFTLQINRISKMYLQIRNKFYDLVSLLTSTPVEAYSSHDRFQCVASSFLSYNATTASFTEWEMHSYYLNVTATKSNNPRTDDFLTRLAHDMISHSNEMDKFVIELNHMLETFRPSVDALITCFGQVPLNGKEFALAKSLRNASSAIDKSSSLTVAINDSYRELSASIRKHSRFPWLIKKKPERHINEVIR